MIIIPTIFEEMADYFSLYCTGRDAKFIQLKIYYYKNCYISMLIFITKIVDYFNANLLIAILFSTFFLKLNLNPNKCMKISLKQFSMIFPNNSFLCCRFCLFFSASLTCFVCDTLQLREAAFYFFVLYIFNCS